jgi:TDG/mug DNA glycosylase family protein
VTEPETYPFETLPDYMAPGMDLVFVGINPSTLSVQEGHYFFRKTNRFWPAFSRSILSTRARAGLGTEALGPEHDAALLAFGIGFTDVVKVPSNNAAQVAPGAFAEWAPRLRERLQRYAPCVACFHGLTGYRPFLRYGLGIAGGADDPEPVLGPQDPTLGSTRLFVVPNPSPANAHFTPADQTAWYDRLAAYLATLPEGR